MGEMGYTERSVAKSSSPSLLLSLSEKHVLPAKSDSDDTIGMHTSEQSGCELSIVHLPPKSDYLADCAIINHALHTVDDSVGVAAFHNEESYGSITTVKALRKNFKESRKFLHFLGVDLSAHQRSDSVNISVGNHGVCWYDPKRYGGVQYDGPLTIFRKVTFSYEQQLSATAPLTVRNAPDHRLQSEPLIHFRCGALSVDHCFSNYVSSPITIVSGICLFSAAILEDVRNLNNDHMQNYEPAVREIVEHPTLHATEAMYRLSQTIADIVLMLRQATSNLANPNSMNGPASTPIRVKLDVARIAYYDIAREMLIAQKWDFSSGRLWLDIVDRRHDALFDEFSSMIMGAVQQRGFNLDSIEIYASSGVREAEQIFRSTIYQQKLPDVQLCLDKLSNEKSSAWSKFLDVAQVSQEQRAELTIKDLACLTYPYEVVEPVLMCSSSTKRRLTIVVDCPFEWRIYNAASRAFNQYNKTHPDAKHLLIGAFPFPRILSTPCKNLYYYDCRRKYLVKADKPKVTDFDEAIPDSTIYLGTCELANLASQFSGMSSQAST